MASSANEPKVVRISQKGLREKFGIETPGEVFVYEEQGRIVIVPAPSPDELQSLKERAHGFSCGVNPVTVCDRNRYSSTGYSVL